MLDLNRSEIADELLADAGRYAEAVDQAADQYAKSGDLDLAAGGVRGGFNPGFTSHDVFNYLLSRRPPGRDTKRVLRPAPKRPEPVQKA